MSDHTITQLTEDARDARSCLLASISPISTRKTKKTAKRKNAFLFGFETYILITHEAYTYVGTEETHCLYKDARGTTPRQFARGFLKDEGNAQSLGPVGKVKDTVQSMVEYWVARTRLWHAQYPDDHETALLVHWDEAESSSDDSDSDGDGEINGDGDGNAVTTPANPSIATRESNTTPSRDFPPVSYHCGPPEHRSRVEFFVIEFTQVANFDPGRIRVMGTDGSPVRIDWPSQRLIVNPPSQPEDFWLRVHITDIMPCHEDCDLGAKYFTDSLADCLRDILERFELVDHPVEIDFWVDRVPGTGDEVLRMLNGGEIVAGGDFMAYVREAPEQMRDALDGVARLFEGVEASRIGLID